MKKIEAYRCGSLGMLHLAMNYNKILYTENYYIII